MANSTLRPGRPSDAIIKLRQYALSEMDKPDRNIVVYKTPDFDLEHEQESSDSDVIVPTLHSSFNKHVGNGRGPIG